MKDRQVVIVGAGPTGATLALLLTQRGVRVTLVEAARDFRRVFRGEGLMPSGLDALAQMGLAHLLDTVPTRPLNAWEFIIGGQSLFRVDEPMGSNSPCTLVSQPLFLESLITEAQQHGLEVIQGVTVKDVLWSQRSEGDDTSTGDRVSGVSLSDGRTLESALVIGADGRNSVVRQRAGLELKTEPKSIDVLWFKLPSHPRLVKNNTFYSIVNQRRVFSLFHSTTEGQMHLAWVVYPDAATDAATGADINQGQSSTAWAETFAELSPDWLAEHFREHANAIASPIKLSVVVGRCPTWHKPGVLVLGDAAHPMSPVRAQGINMALRDVIVAVNHLVPIFREDGGQDNAQEHALPEAKFEQLDEAIAAIQAEREPDIIGIQQLQAEETHRGELLRSNAFLRNTLLLASPISGPLLRTVWSHKQQTLRRGITSVQLVR